MEHFSANPLIIPFFSGTSMIYLFAGKVNIWVDVTCMFSIVKQRESGETRWVHDGEDQVVCRWPWEVGRCCGVGLIVDSYTALSSSDWPRSGAPLRALSSASLAESRCSGLWATKALPLCCMQGQSVVSTEILCALSSGTVDCNQLEYVKLIISD